MKPALSEPSGVLITERLWLRPASRQHVSALLGYSIANRAHLQPWEPSRPEAFYTLPSIEARLESMEKQIAAGLAIHLLFFDKEEGQLIGDCNFTNIVRGPFQACHLGFSIAHDHEGRGLMRECLATAIQYMFAELGLHRVMANYRPENKRSAQLLNKLGFEQEGIARAYLKINGVWADHVLTSLINPADV
ncbi:MULTISPECIES: GNAT family N-acetyltransferase [Paraburkholderia]|nr:MULTISPECIES: GNAT family N-acetyltransferase [Paraburkholderia]